MRIEKENIMRIEKEKCHQKKSIIRIERETQYYEKESIMKRKL